MFDAQAVNVEVLGDLADCADNEDHPVCERDAEDDSGGDPFRRPLVLSVQGENEEPE